MANKPYVNASANVAPGLGTDQWPMTVNADGTLTAAVAAGAAAAAIKASSGRLSRVLVTVAGTAQLNFYDNPSAGSGTIIGLVPASAILGQVLDFHFPALTGIWCASGAGTPGVTVSYV